MTVWEGLNPPYATIVADPPWPYEDQALPSDRAKGRTKFLAYSSMSLSDLAALQIGELGTVDAHLFLWTTQRFLWKARDLADWWGFKVLQVLVWAKPPMGHATGGAFPPNVEFVLACRRRWGSVIRCHREALGISTAEMERIVRGGPNTGLGTRWEESSSLPRPEHWDGLRALFGVDLHVAGDLRPTASSWWNWPRAGHSVKPAGFMDVIEYSAPGPYVELFARAPRLGWDSWGKGYESGAA